MFDSHIHLDLIENMIPFADACQKNKLGLFAVGTTPQAFERELVFLRGFSNIRVGLGFHPQLIGSGYDDIKLFARLVTKSRYIGEVGLDFSKNYISTREKQIEDFEEIIKLCESIGSKVISVHSLKAVSKVLDVIEKNKMCDTNIYILHWFTGSLSQLKRALQLECYISINPKMIKTKSGQEIIKMIPHNRILIETDAPFGINCVNVHELGGIMNQTVLDISRIKECDMQLFLETTEKIIY